MYAKTFQQKCQAGPYADIVINNSNKKSLFYTGIDGHIFIFRRTVTFRPP